MKKLMALVALMIGSTLLAIPTLPASAGTIECVSLSEWRQIDDGMRKSRVHEIFGTNGRGGYTYTVEGIKFEDRDYKMCPGTGYERGYVKYRNPIGDGNDIWRVNWKGLD